jgi:hypothetical protein
MPVIPAFWEAEAGGLRVQSQCGLNSKTPFQINTTKNDTEHLTNSSSSINVSFLSLLFLIHKLL